MDAFKTAWIESQNFEKAEKLSKSELAEVRKTIQDLQKKGMSSSKIIKHLQKTFSKLSEEYQASRAYWTEVKRNDTEIVAEAAEELDIDKYKVILSPNPCPICVSKTNNGSKVFKTSDIDKSGYGHVPPFHPNCYCIIIPTA